MADADLDELLATFGYTGDVARHAARDALVAAGLTSGKKRRIDTAKVAAVRSALERALVPVCRSATCVTAAARLNAGARPVETEPAACAICGGSENRRAATRLAASARGGRRPRLVVVGGSPEARTQLVTLARGVADLRLVDGLGRATEDHARTDIAWADVVLIWGSTQLDHKVSNHYSRAASAITVPRRGVAALLDAAADRLERTRERRP